MKYVFILIPFFALKAFDFTQRCNKIANGKYWVHFITAPFEDYRLKVIDSSFVQYLSNHDTAGGKIKWLYNCTFQLDFSKRDKDSVSGPLKSVYSSWGAPCIELNEVNGDTIKFRTTHTHNLHITVNEGYFLRLRK